ncbi:iron ABC transporter permease [Chloroflexi bacterium TSY]|nr:iron ABC transporter permease [Chloroflexi bacterium TSY]
MHVIATQARLSTITHRVFRRTQWLRLFVHGTSLLIASLLLLPLAYLLVRSVRAGQSALFAMSTPRTALIAGNSLLLAAIVLGISILVSLPLAWLTTRTDLPGRRVWTILTVLPLVFPSYVGSYALVAMMGPRGILQGWLAPFGIERMPSIYGLAGATCALTAFTYPYLLLAIRSGLRHMDPALEEAARNLGYTSQQTFWRITIPSLRPSLASGSLLVTLYVLSDFGAVSMLRYNTFTRAIYIGYTNSFDRSQAALLALALVLITILLLFGAQRTLGRGAYYRSSSGVARKQNRVKLGKWRWPALLFIAIIVSVSLIIPTGVVVYWLVRGLLAGESLLPVWQSLLNSIQAATLASIACILLASPIAFLAVRHPGFISMLVSQAANLGYALPGIAVALSLVFFGANSTPLLYQTLAMLVFAYVVRFLPQALGAIRSMLLQISPRMEEASRSLGRSQLHTLRLITIPLLRPGIWAGAALVFLTTLKELPATLILSPTGFSTLATQIWSATEEAFFARAAAPALILLVVSAFSIGIILHQEER